MKDKDNVVLFQFLLHTSTDCPEWCESPLCICQGRCGGCVESQMPQTW